jgi:hypothetical protein
MKKSVAVTVRHLQLPLLVLLVVCGTAFTQCSAQNNHCGNPKTGNACPGGCSGSSQLKPASFADDGIAYVASSQVYCGTNCGYVNATVVITYPCMPASSKTMTSELVSKLRQIAGDREVLLPGCGNTFKTLEDPPVTTESAQVRSVGGFPLSNTNSELRGFPW